ncbi:hypothetical protein DID77_04145 [Candidatus Marinamargulisbacteria bacterium SCGC AG-439-L15]|nr:hypothetical protein DID77_04145 [Candidatus Marinamargulisbacteria bacterium SCGC AG-439-L15]
MLETVNAPVYAPDEYDRSKELYNETVQRVEAKKFRDIDVSIEAFHRQADTAIARAKETKSRLLAKEKEAAKRELALKIKEEAPKFVTYTVQPGDWLAKIARSKYNAYLKWNEIFKLNKHLIKNPSLIYPGQVLRLPK